MLWALVCVSACGGGGSGGASTPPPPPAPSGLSYPTPPAFVVNTAIASLSPTVSGTVTSYSVSPTLPAGLAISATTGVISGTPTAIAPSASYTVTASNSSGSATAEVTVAVNDVAVAGLGYFSAAYSFTKGVQANTIAPQVSGGAVTMWSVDPALPDGLTLSSSDGSISGTPTAGSPAATYTVTASNSGGQSAANLTIAVSGGPVLDLGHGAGIDAIRITGTRVLSHDGNGHWVLWDFATAANLGNGTVPCQSFLCSSDVPPALAGPTVVVPNASGFDIRASSDSRLLSRIAATPSWWMLATDGSYLCAGSMSGLTAWSPSGSVLVSLSGDYSNAKAAALPAAILVALGPAGTNVVQTISVTTGNSTTGAAYQGTFGAWFGDDSGYVTVDGHTLVVRVYSNASALEDTRAVPALAGGVGGYGGWFWAVGSNVAGQVDSLNVYAVGNSATPALSYGSPPTAFGLTPSGSTLAILAGSQVSVIDLSGASVSKVDYPLQETLSIAYAAVSKSQWMGGDNFGVLFDGSALPATTRDFGYGRALSIAGGKGHYAVATASGKILHYDSTSNASEGEIGFDSSNLAMSADGTTLAAMADTTQPTQARPDRSVNVYTLPAGTLLANFPSTFSASRRFDP
jgi:hypothetical protein